MEKASHPSNPYGAITDVGGLAVGQVERIGDGWLTGVTAVIPPQGTIGAADVRGAGPGTHETDMLAPGTLADTVDAIALAGGSSFGLAAAGGVQRWCEEAGRGLTVGPGVVVPIVPGAIVFDLGRGGDPTARPDDAMGYAAAAAARSGGPVRTGVVGAGTGATLTMAGLKGGVGTASVWLPGGVVVGALVVANAFGSPCVPGSAALSAAPLVADPSLRPRTPDPDTDPVAETAAAQSNPPASANTTLAVVATNAALSHGQAGRMAVAGHDGMARALRPLHTLVDGDTVFGLATGQIDPRVAAIGDWGGREEIGGLTAVQAAAADAVSLAIIDAVLAARTVPAPTRNGSLRSYLDRYPTARPTGWQDPAV